MWVGTDAQVADLSRTLVDVPALRARGLPGLYSDRACPSDDAQVADLSRTLVDVPALRARGLPGLYSDRACPSDAALSVLPLPRRRHRPAQSPRR